VQDVGKAAILMPVLRQFAGLASVAPRRGAARIALAALCVAAGAAPVHAQEIDLQLQEIRILLKERRYPLALESLRLVARQIQDLRLAAVAPAFPDVPPGWTATPPLSLLEEGDVWSDRVEAQRTYAPSAGQTRVDLVIDLNSPLAPAVAMSLNPLVTAADPQTRIVDVGGHRGRARFAPDTGEGEVRVLLGREIVITARGRGIAGIEPLLELIGRVDFAFLRAKAGL
jgi:hypothetical protein